MKKSTKYINIDKFIPNSVWRNIVAGTSPSKALAVLEAVDKINIDPRTYRDLAGKCKAKYIDADGSQKVVSTIKKEFYQSVFVQSVDSSLSNDRKRIIWAVTENADGRVVLLCHKYLTDHMGSKKKQTAYKDAMEEAAKLTVTPLDIEKNATSVAELIATFKTKAEPEATAQVAPVAQPEPQMAIEPVPLPQPESVKTYSPIKIARRHKTDLDVAQDLLTMLITDVDNVALAKYYMMYFEQIVPLMNNAPSSIQIWARKCNGQAGMECGQICNNFALFIVLMTLFLNDVTVDQVAGEILSTFDQNKLQQLLDLLHVLSTSKIPPKDGLATAIRTRTARVATGWRNDETEKRMLYTLQAIYNKYDELKDTASMSDFVSALGQKCAELMISTSISADVPAIRKKQNLVHLTVSDLAAKCGTTEDVIRMAFKTLRFAGQLSLYNIDQCSTSDGAIMSDTTKFETYVKSHAEEFITRIRDINEKRCRKRRRKENHFRAPRPKFDETKYILATDVLKDNNLNQSQLQHRKGQLIKKIWNEHELEFTSAIFDEFKSSKEYTKYTDKYFVRLGGHMLFVRETLDEFMALTASARRSAGVQTTAPAATPDVALPELAVKTAADLRIAGTYADMLVKIINAAKAAQNEASKGLALADAKYNNVLQVLSSEQDTATRQDLILKLDVANTNVKDHNEKVKKYADIINQAKKLQTAQDTLAREISALYGRVFSVER